jgi:hypothetical protein
MAKKDLYSSLQQIATESVVGPAAAKAPDANKLIAAEEKMKLDAATKRAMSMYPNAPEDRFNYWKKSVDTTGLSNEAKQYYWKAYQDLNPRGFEGTKEDFINVTARELKQISGTTAKEFFLRDRIANSPDWVKPILEPELAKISTVVANANYNKSAQVYADDVRGRSKVFLSKATLDPDTAIDDHTNDLVRLEQLNLLDVADVVNGRAGVYKDDGTFVPSFAIKDRNDIFNNDIYGSPSAAEQLKVKETASPYFKEAIEESIYMNRNKIKQDERASEAAATKMLEEGKFTVDKWGEAFSMVPESDKRQQIIRGIKGEIAAKRVSSYKDLAQTIYTAMSQYGDMLGDMNNG